MPIRRPDHGCHGYSSSRNSVLWAFSSLVVQHDQAPRLNRIQATSTRGVRARIRRVACATPTGFAGHAGATANLKLTFHLDHSAGAGQLGLLHELAPKASTIAVLGDANEPELEIELREIEAAGRAVRRQILVVKAGSERELNGLFSTMVQAGARALLVRGSPLFLTRRRQLVALAARHALLASYPSRDYVEVGGLMSYGPDITDAYRRVGIYVGRILKSEKPADLPVEMASKFNLAINLATAKAIDFDIPPMLLARADEVIE